MFIKRTTKRVKGKLYHNHLLVDNYLQKNLRDNARYQGKKLNRHEYQVFSQSGEDGIIEEIFQRIRPTNRFLVEFEAGNGSENNSTSRKL